MKDKKATRLGSLRAGVPPKEESLSSVLSEAKITGDRGLRS